MRPGDEVVISRLDHEANRGPWIAAAADAGATVREIAVDPATCTLDLGSLDAVLSERTRLVAVGCASNAVGTINPVVEIVRRAHAVGAWTFVDAVHYAPHGSLDVVGLGTDFLACSAYKFFGPHVGILWGRAGAHGRMPACKVRPASDRWETGTQNHEGIAGTLAAVEYLADVGRRFGAADAEAGVGSSRRARLSAGMRAIEAYERELSARVLAGSPRARADGPRPGRPGHSRRTPTFAVTMAGEPHAGAGQGIYA
jgi:selenocysteine lyase/cysteine desulfurase